MPRRADIEDMFRPRITPTSAVRPVTAREVRCRMGAMSDLREVGGDPFSDLMDDQAVKVQRLIDQVRAWSQHPSASTWSKPQQDSE